MAAERDYEVVLNTERRTFAPGDDVWVTVQLRRTSGAAITADSSLYGGSVGLVGEERTTLPGGMMGSSSIFEPILVYLEASAATTMWRVNLRLPADIPPSCDLGAIPPCGMVLYVLTARIQVPGAGNKIPPLTASKRIRVVSTPKMAEMKAADVSGYVVDNLTFRFFCCTRPPVMRQQETSQMTLEANTPEFRVVIPNKTSFRCGEHLKYRITVRGQGPNGKSVDRKFSRVDGLRIWIRRQRWFSDGRNESTSSDAAKQAQVVDFTGSAAGVLPVDYESNISIPLGIAPTTRGSILSNEYDLVVELIISGRECGMIEIPITIWRDVEGNFLSPSFSQTLRTIKVNMESTHNGDGCAEDEEEKISANGEAERMDHLAHQ